ncbi:Golgi integral membrane 4-like isoform X1 [Labeo rohita]|uniref:Golgi integral membrane 4-like isoform X1 n=1 Tax=Labeo rohita TaxID=84645 RepID=A0A498P650_LABRO|nr:Golgi integral membrane 4-like isoform X1 [Labeo rohita]
MPSLRHAAGQPQPHEAAHPIQPGQNGNEEEHHQPQNAQPEVEKHDEVEKPQPHHKEEDGEMGGAEERRRELAEEEMEQAGQPQKLEEEFDVAHNGEEEPQANQPDENALEREQRHAHEVRTLLNVNIINIKS